MIASPLHAAPLHRAIPPPLSPSSALAAQIKALVISGELDAARDRFSELVLQQQRRAIRIACQYLRNPHDADEAVQDAFVKVFTHITKYREDLQFDVWFTRILVNGCLDLRKTRARRWRWAVTTSENSDASPREPATRGESPEQRLIASSRTRQIATAVKQLPDRQRSVFTLCQIAEQSTREVSDTLGLSEATVRVHLFRAVRKLRLLLDRNL